MPNRPRHLLRPITSPTSDDSSASPVTPATPTSTPATLDDSSASPATPVITPISIPPTPPSPLTTLVTLDSDHPDPVVIRPEHWLNQEFGVYCHYPHPFASKPEIYATEGSGAMSYSFSQTSYGNNSLEITNEYPALNGDGDIVRVNIHQGFNSAGNLVEHTASIVPPPESPSTEPDDILLAEAVRVVEASEDSDGTEVDVEGIVLGEAVTDGEDDPSAALIAGEPAGGAGGADLRHRQQTVGSTIQRGLASAFTLLGSKFTRRGDAHKYKRL